MSDGVRVVGEQLHLEQDCWTITRQNSFPTLALALILSLLPHTHGLTVAVNIDPQNPSGYPHPANLTALGATAVRIEFKDTTSGSPTPSSAALSFYKSAVSLYHSAGIQVLLILDYSTLLDVPATKPSTEWNTYISNFAGRAKAIADAMGYMVSWMEIWNEEDLAPQPGYNPYVPAEQYACLLAAAYSAIHTASPSTQVLVGGLASGVPDYVSKIAASSCGLHADAVGIHPYGRRPSPNWPSSSWGFGVLTDLVDQYYAVAHLPIVITEVGTNDMSVQPDFPLHTFNALQSSEGSTHCSVVFWFCWSDAMVAPFGLLDKNGGRKPSWTSFHSFLHE